VNRPTVKATLSDRELEVVALVARGLTNREIGEALLVSMETVKAHMYHLGRKLGARNRAHVVALAARTGQWWPEGTDPTIAGVNSAWARRMDAATKALRKAEGQRDEYRRKYLKTLETLMELREGETR
jgi:DNA-binding CsgD family transcriptional regulator